MPTYVYQCENRRCRHRFELTHPQAERGGLHICPRCGQSSTHRVPQSAPTTWGGLPPSRGEMSRTVRNLVDESNRRRRVERYRKEKHLREEGLWQ